MMRKRSLDFGDYRTSVDLEDVFWEALAEIADHDGVSRSDLVRRLHQNRRSGSFSSELRTFAMTWFRTRAVPPPASLEQGSHNG